MSEQALGSGGKKNKEVQSTVTAENAGALTKGTGNVGTFIMHPAAITGR